MKNYGLNDEQLKALYSPSPVWLNASAGSGKTRTLLAKIQSLLDSGVPVKNILAVTFTNKAAKEMKDRLSKFCKSKEMQVSTIHSFCVQIIRKFIKHTHLKYPFTIYDDKDQQSIIKTIVKAKDLPGEPWAYLSQISRAKSENREPEDPLYLSVYKRYQKILKQNNACDFDDLLIFAYKCLQQTDCKEYYSKLWTHILVDEFQDTSKIQYDIIMSIYDRAITQTLFAVGDANQSIYSWRSARPENISTYIKEHKANDLSLTYNYRSCSEIIEHANSFLQFGSPMVPKAARSGRVSVTAFSSFEDEAEKIAQALLKMGNYNNTAIIYRVNTRSVFFEQTFSKYRIPYKVVSELPFYQRKVSKDLLAALKASNNPDDRESLSRIINNPKRGFGDAKKEQLLLRGRDFIDEISEDMPRIKSFIELLDDIKGKTPSQALTEYLDRSEYRANLEKDSDIYMVSALENMMPSFETVEELVLASTFLERDSGEGVSLISAHGSKGLEFDRVFVVGVEEGLWPHKNSDNIEEEARLFYVAVTRAMKGLNISYSRSRTFRGNPIVNSPSNLFCDSYRHIHGKDFYGHR